MKKSTKIIITLLVFVMVFSLSASAYSAEQMADSVTGWLQKNITVE